MSEAAATVHDGKPVQMPLKFLLGCLSAAAAVGVAYFAVIRDLRDEHKINLIQDKRLETLENGAILQREVFYDLRAEVRANREQTAIIIEMLKKRDQ